MGGKVSEGYKASAIALPPDPLKARSQLLSTRGYNSVVAIGTYNAMCGHESFATRRTGPGTYRICDGLDSFELTGSNVIRIDNRTPVWHIRPVN